MRGVLMTERVWDEVGCVSQDRARYMPVRRSIKF